MPGQLLSYLQSRYPRQRTRMNRQHTNSSIQVIRRHQQLQTQLWRDLHIRHIGLVLVLVVVAEILADFLQDDSTEGLEHTATGDCFGEVAFSPLKRSQCVWLFDGVRKGARGVLDGSSMRRIVPETQAVLRGTTNSKPSPETRVTYSAGDVDMLLARERSSGQEAGFCRVEKSRRRCFWTSDVGPCRSL